MKRIGFMRPTNEHAMVIASVVRVGLESKYGKPVFDRAKSDAGGFSPSTSSKTCVSLRTQNRRSSRPMRSYW